MPVQTQTYCKKQVIKHPNKAVEPFSPDVLLNLLTLQYETHTQLIPILGDENNTTYYPSIADTYFTLSIVKQQEQTEKEQSHYLINNNEIGIYEKLHSPINPIELEDIFQADGNREPQRLLIVGRAGIGKTTLCQYIAYQWLHKKLWPGKFEWIFWIPLRNLVEANYKHIKRGDCADKVIAAVVNQECLANKADNMPGLIKLFTELSSEAKFLLILDGYDEIAEAHAKQNDSLVGWIIQQLLNYPRYVLTSRPYSLSSHLKIDKTLENIGFSGKNIESYIKKFFNQQPNDGERLTTFLQTNPNIRGIAYIPLMLNLLCNLWKSRQQNKIYFGDITVPKLYEDLVDFIAKKYLTKRTQNPIALHDLNNMLKTDIRNACQPILQVLGRLAFNALTQSASIIMANELIENTLKTFESPGNLLTDLKELGFIKGIASGKSDAEKDYYFIHLTFEEYFASRYMVNNLNDCPTIEQQLAVWGNKLFTHNILIREFLVEQLQNLPSATEKLKALIFNGRQDKTEAAKIAAANAITLLCRLAAFKSEDLDFSGIEIPHANFSNQRGNYPGISLIAINFSNANLYKTNLSRVDLSRANLSGANLKGINLSGAHLSGTNLSGLA